MSRTQIANLLEETYGRRPTESTIGDAVRRAKAQGLGFQRFKDEKMNAKKKARNQRILKMVADGKTDKEIAGKFKLTSGAIVKIRHKARIYKYRRRLVSFNRP